MNYQSDLCSNARRRMCQIFIESLWRQSNIINMTYCTCMRSAYAVIQCARCPTYSCLNACHGNTWIIILLLYTVTKFWYPAWGIAQHYHGNLWSLAQEIKSFHDNYPVTPLGYHFLAPFSNSVGLRITCMNTECQEFHVPLALPCTTLQNSIELDVWHASM